MLKTNLTTKQMIVGGDQVKVRFVFNHSDILKTTDTDLPIRYLAIQHNYDINTYKWKHIYIHSIKNIHNLSFFFETI